MHAVCDSVACMAMTEDDIAALRILIQEETRSAIHEQLEPFRIETMRRLDGIASQIDGLYKRDETREQEFLAVCEQIRRIEFRLDDGEGINAS